MLVAAACVGGRIAFTQESVSEHLWLLYYDLPNAPVFRGVKIPILLGFVLCGVTFIPLGQLVAQRLSTFRDRGAALWGYSFDLLGSLIGVIVFAIVSFAGAFPSFWFGGLFVVGALLFLSRGWRAIACYVLIAAGIIALVVMSTRAQHYSPYYALSTDPDRDGGLGIAVLANGSLHQYASHLRMADAISTEREIDMRAGYHEPYRLLPRPPRRVLVLGAGTGNDVATALDEGVEHVDAVEIDPVIIQLGHSIHPDNPYADPRVRVINTDARQFLNSTNEKYDLIVFGTLDSMTRLSALSNVRLDNFVYTTDCLRSAAAHLAPDGGVVMYFMVSADYIQKRLFWMLTTVFGEAPASKFKYHYMFNTTYLAGPAFKTLGSSSIRAAALLKNKSDGIELASDDWPYLYLMRRGVSSFYLTLIAAIGVISVMAVAASAPQMFRSARAAQNQKRGGVDLEMFLFGVAFLLLETKSVTEMNLLWGATWITSAAVFGSILVMLLASTLIMQWKPLPYALSFGCLAVSLVVAYLVPLHFALGKGMIPRLIFSGLFVGLPLFFASACFAVRFKTRVAPDLAFGWNLLGAVAGGLLEFSSMAIGFRLLALVALGAYVIAFLVSRGGKRQSESVEAENQNFVHDQPTVA